MTEHLQALQAVIDANGQPVFALDRDLRYTAFNQAHAAVMRDSTAPRSPSAAAFSTTRPWPPTARPQAPTSSAPWPGSRSRPWPSPARARGARSFEVVHTPQADAAGAIVGIVVRARDVTEEAALSQNRTLLAAIIEGTSDAVYVKDTAGRYLLFNAAAERVTGKLAEEVLGKDDRFLFPPDEAEVVMAGDRAVMDGAESMTYEEDRDRRQRQALYLSEHQGPHPWRRR